MISAPRMGGRRLAALVAGLVGLAALILGLAAAGYRRPAVADLAAAASPNRFYRVTVASAGVKLSVPADWLGSSGQGSLRAVISSGPAVIALWRYPGVGVPLSTTAAERALLAGVHRRDPGFSLIAAGTGTLNGAGTVILDGVERIGGLPRRVRSEHVYTPSGEIVFETYAPVGEFKRIDHLVFSPVRRSLRLLSPVHPAIPAAAGLAGSAGTTGPTGTTGSAGTAGSAGATGPASGTGSASTITPTAPVVPVNPTTEPTPARSGGTG